MKHRTIVLRVTVDLSIPEDERFSEHEESLCSVIEDIPGVSLVEVLEPTPKEPPPP